MVTDDDRARASAMYGSWFGGDEMDNEIIGDIAAALAAEREKARSPFLALADAIADESVDAIWHRDCLREVSARIRQAAQAEP